MSRQPVHFTDVAAVRKRLRVQVVGREVIASGDRNTREVPLLAGHAMQRLDRAHNRQIWNELVVGVHEQLCPWPVDGHRFDRLAVAREPPVFDDPALLQQCDRLSIRHAVEGNRQLELVGGDAEIGARHRHTL